MPCPLANEFNVHSLHQEVTNVGVPQPVKRDRCHLGSGDKPTKRFAKRVGVHRLAIETSKYKSVRIPPKSEFQSLFELRLIVPRRASIVIAGRVTVRRLVLVFGDLNSILPLMRSSD